MISKTKDINFSAITHTSDLSFIAFRDYKWQYVAIIISTIAILALGLGGMFAIIFLAAGFYFGGEIVKKKRNIFQQFAQDTNWTYTPIAMTQPPTGIRWAGRSPQYEHAVTGEFAGSYFVLYKYTYTVGSGKSSSDYPTTVIEFQLPTDFPYMLLDSKNNSRGAVHIPKASQKISLEGNFDAEFQMYAKDNQQIDALSVITPDVMQTVLDTGSRYDIEIYKNRLYLYAEGDLRSAASIDKLFLGAEKILAELQHKAKTFRPSQPIKELEEKDMKGLTSLLGVNTSVSMSHPAEMLNLAGLVIAVIAMFGMLFFIFSVFA